MEIHVFSCHSDVIKFVTRFHTVKSIGANLVAGSGTNGGFGSTTDDGSVQWDYEKHLLMVQYITM